MTFDSPEYTARLRKPFKPPQVTLKQIHDAVPKHLLKKNAFLSSSYIVRDVGMCAALFLFAAHIPTISQTLANVIRVPADNEWLVRASLWLSYWWWQGIVFAGFFCIAHELGHHALFDSWYANNIPGFLLHSFILAPFFAWKASHNAHHKTVGNIEKDENYVPFTRQHYNLPPQERARRADYKEILEETPLYTAASMLVMQFLGWQLYLRFFALLRVPSESKLAHVQLAAVPTPWDPHDIPKEPTTSLRIRLSLLKNNARKGILASDIALASMLSLLFLAGQHYGWMKVLMMYGPPYLLCNHWIVLVTYLHHSDPSIPHYRKGEWSFLRGAAATVDRPVLGWIGRFFFHNVSHDHVAHHFFSGIPFCEEDNSLIRTVADGKITSTTDNLEEVTRAIRGVLGDDYNYDSTNSFYALYRSFTQCVFIEDEGDIVFYKNVEGEAQRMLAKDSIVTTIQPKSLDDAPKIVVVTGDHEEVMQD
ncbi:hypothetical protein EIP91_007304 [Steccherinum ochraceum]|uniref:Fatty acid desaturase domain-containing protein n=1 Tax=Steccherinum ochraceum TaxID=92696 RepID=A0A4R0RCK8_9APHY|nr:hypothetical protein EIP91_007304 [Steccherinum ochraceum]